MQIGRIGVEGNTHTVYTKCTKVSDSTVSDERTVCARLLGLTSHTICNASLNKMVVMYNKAVYAIGACVTIKLSWCSTLNTACQSVLH